MRKLRDILRLRLQAELSLRQIKRSLRLSLGAVQGITSRVDELKLTWADINALDDQQLADLFYPSADTRVSSGFQVPDWATIHQELRRKGVTKHLLWEEYTQAYRVKYYRLSRLLLELTQTKADGSYSRALQTLSRLDLLIIDDWGLEPLNLAYRNDLMEIMDDRHGASSTLMISQLPTDQWHTSIGDNTLADAILDRLMHNAHRIKLKGESMRKKQAIVDGS